MRCPECGAEKPRVIKTKGDKRRRECRNCGSRFTTTEVFRREAEAVPAPGAKPKTGGAA